jgi:AhpC/TSA family protein
VTRGRARAALTAFCLLACGNNPPEVPQELLAGGSSCAAPDYPDAELGAEVGNVMANACFVGYRAPDRVTPIAAHRETVAFSDYYDPAGTKGVSLLLINTAAIWCSACVSEHVTLPEHAEALAPQGLVIISTLFQDAQKNGASLEDLERWIENFQPNFPMVADPEIQLEPYASPASAPLNMLVDPRSMKILRKYVGDQGAVMWPYIESELARRSAAN